MPTRFVFKSGWENGLNEAAAPLIARLTDDIAADAREHCPVDTGELKASIRTEHGQGYGRVWVGTDHWRYVEYGTAPHIITPRDKQALFWPGAQHPVARVHHPGTPAQPFMRPAIYKRRSP